MLSYIRDVITVLVFVSIFAALIWHTIRQEFGWMFEKSATAKPSKTQPKFQGSAASWVK